MKEVVVWAEIRNRRLTPVSLELIGKARELAERIGGSVSAVLLGHECAFLAQTIIVHGVSKVYVAEDPRLGLYQCDLYANVMYQILSKIRPEIVIIGGTSIGMDLAPRVAAKLRTGLTAHCVELYIEKIEGKDCLVQVVPGWSGNLMVRIICPERRPQMVTVRPGVFEPGRTDASRKGSVLPIIPDISENDIRARTLEFIPEETEGGSLDNAEIVVSGGFGLESAGGFGLIEALAEAVHGEVAGTRPACDKGWIPESRMIGQSGKTVKPKLFLSVGASGALHYTTGFHKSKVIVAIDKNPKATIFAVADLGIAGDLRKIVPCLIEAFEENIQNSH